MTRVTGIGGVFFNSSDPKALQDRYVRHLGIEPDDDGYVVMRWGGEQKRLDPAAYLRFVAPDTAPTRQGNPWAQLSVFGERHILRQVPQVSGCQGRRSHPASSPQVTGTETTSAGSPSSGECQNTLAITGVDSKSKSPMLKLNEPQQPVPQVAVVRSS